MTLPKVETTKQVSYTNTQELRTKPLSSTTSPLLSFQSEQDGAGVSLEHTTQSNPQHTVSSVTIKDKDGKTYNFNETLEKRINSVTAKTEKAEKENGLIGKAWSWAKNTVGFGDSTDKVKEIQANEMKLLAQFNSNENTRASIFKELTGYDYTEENLEKFIKNQIKLKSEIAIDKYKEGQDMAVDITSDIVSGVVAYGTAAACIAGGIAAAPFTAGASLGAVAVGVGIATGAGAVTKVAIKGGESAIGGKEYSLKQAGKDATIGAVSGALAPITVGAGGAVANSVGKVAPKFIATTARLSVEGATFGAVDGGVRSALEGDSIDDVALNTLKGAGVGALTGNVLGHGGSAVGKMASKTKEIIRNNFKNWFSGTDVPKFTVSKKRIADLYPKSDESTINAIKEDLADNYEIEKFSFYGNSENPNYIFYKGSQSGSNPGCWGVECKTGDLYYFKTGNGEQNITEHVSALLYKEAGIEVPETSLVNPSRAHAGILNPSEVWVKSKAIAGLEHISSNPQCAYEGFAVDAWLANWDAVCSGNTLLKGNTAVRIDFGGCLNFRARGGAKTYSFDVPELSSLLNPKINPQSANVFKNMTREDLINSLKRVQSVTDEDIQKIYCNTYQYIEPDIFINIYMRKNYLAFILKEAEKTEIKPNQTLIEYIDQISAKIKPEFNKFTQSKMKELSKIGYQDVIDDMLAQRSQMHNTYYEGMTVEASLNSIKFMFLGLNNDIRYEICSNIGKSNFVIKPTEKMVGLDNLIKQSKIPRDITLWRAASPYDFALREMDTETFLRAFYQKDKMFQIPIYPETSLDYALPKAMALRHSSTGSTSKAIIFKYNVEGGTNGVYMERFSDEVNFNNNSEEEILLGRNLVGKFKSRTSYDDYELIEVDIVPETKIGNNTVHKFWEEAPTKDQWDD